MVIREKMEGICMDPLGLCAGAKLSCQVKAARSQDLDGRGSSGVPKCNSVSHITMEHSISFCIILQRTFVRI